MKDEDAADLTLERLDDFVSTSTAYPFEVPTAIVSAVLLQRGVELAIECGIPEEGLLDNVRDFYQRAAKGDDP